MADYFVDVRDHGAGSTRDDTAAFNQASEYAFKRGGVLVARGVFTLTGNVNIFSDCDFSQARIIINGGKLTVTQHSSEVRELTLKSNAVSKPFDPAKLTY